MCDNIFIESRRKKVSAIKKLTRMPLYLMSHRVAIFRGSGSVPFILMEIYLSLFLLVTIHNLWKEYGRVSKFLNRMIQTSPNSPLFQ